MEYWKDGTAKQNGMMEYWNNGILECWEEEKKRE